jgi:hypothetical protein
MQTSVSRSTEDYVKRAPIGGSGGMARANISVGAVPKVALALLLQINGKRELATELAWLV